MTLPDEYGDLSRKSLKEKIAETQALLVELEAEMEKRELDREHKAVDHLDDYIVETDQSILSLISYAKKLIAGEKKS